MVRRDTTFAGSASRSSLVASALLRAADLETHPVPTVLVVKP